MAIFKTPLTPEQVKRSPVSQIRDEYNTLAADYNRLFNWDYILCPTCGKPIKRDNFYASKEYAIGVYPECKDCVIARVEQRKKKNDVPNETKQSVQDQCRRMNWPYLDSVYEDMSQSIKDEGDDAYRGTPWRKYAACIRSLPQWSKLTWIDSDFGDGLDSSDEEEIKISQKTLKAAKKRFGSGYTPEEYMFLENEYQDWICRYECNTKANEEVFENLSIIKLLKKKAIASGNSTKDLDKQQQDWLDAGALKPKQNSMDTMSDAQTMGTLLQKYEETRPLPDIDPELKDVDKIGLYFDVFFRGHASKMLGLKNTFSHIYENFMKRYTVSKPEYSGDEDSEAVFEKVFGNSSDE